MKLTKIHTRQICLKCFVNDSEMLFNDFEMLCVMILKGCLMILKWIFTEARQRPEASVGAIAASEARKRRRVWEEGGRGHRGSWRFFGIKMY